MQKLKYNKRAVNVASCSFTFFMEHKNRTIYANSDKVLIEGLVPELKTLIKK